MPHTSITFEEFPSNVHFGTVSVGPRGGAFDAKNLAADSINVDAANEPITGIFNVTSLLALVTSNAPVDVVIGLENDDQDYTTAAILKTSNGPIQATIDLLKPGSSRSPSHGGKYYVIATTTNERLDIDFPTSPVEAILQVHGNTTNDAASVSLNPAYEGSFQLGTSNELVHVEKRRVTDPSGMGRKRGISIVYARAALVYGEVAWGKMPDEHGNLCEVSLNWHIGTTVMAALQWSSTQVTWPDDFAVPLDINTSDCAVNWDEIPRNTPSLFPLHASTSFDVPYDLNTMLFLARGSSAGDFTILTTDKVSDVARVDVIVSYHHDYVRDRAKVCYIERKNGAAGVGIFTPRAWIYPSVPREEQLRFNVIVSLPASSDGKPLPIKDFEADMPLFALAAVHLEESVYFRKISLISENMPVTAESILADVGLFKSTNGPITGSFNTTSSLKLITTNAPIKADVGLTNDNERPTQVLLKSQNGMIQSSVSLLRDDDSAVGGKYDVNAITTNSGLQVDFPASPIDSTLVLNAHTTNSGATVSLNPAYEGQFVLKSTIFRPDVRKTVVSDPAGRGRRRTVEYDEYTRAVVSGKVKWTGSTKRDGIVNVGSTNAKVVLKL
ncbi:hypothetical protein ONZ45_g19185 [Pleurotus djamor]|nr:hypothetical protein ONZ45_g19185 [Pleurotus djamor]